MTILELFLVVWILLAIAYLGDSVWKLWQRSRGYPSVVYEVLTALILLLNPIAMPSTPYDHIGKPVIVICVVTAIVLRAIGRKRFAVAS